MKKLLFFFLILNFGILKTNGQIPYTVVYLKGINLRDTSSINGKIIKKLDFGSVILAKINQTTKYDTVDNLVGYWIACKYNNLSGFVFSPYIYEGNLVDNNISHNTFRLTREGISNGAISYHPNLIWYGLYQDSVGFFIERVNPRIILSNVDGMDPFKNLDCLDERGNILLKTERNYPSILLFGTHQNWKEGRIKNTFFNISPDFEKDFGFLYPEQKMIVGHYNATVYFRAYEKLITDKNCNIKRKHQLECYFYDSQQSFKDTVNLSNYLSLSKPSQDHCEYKTPKIYWVGDINSDGLVDFIIHQHSMVNHGGVVWTKTLFMTKYINGKFIVEKIAEEIRGGCH